MANFPAQIFKTSTGSEFWLRSAELRDAEALIAFLHQAAMDSGDFFLTTLEEFNKITVEEERRYIQNHLENPFWLLLIAEINGAIVGLLNVANGHRLRASHIATLGISIDKGFQHQGMGQQMMISMIDWARKTNKIEKIDLQVDTTNLPAIALYEKLGFQSEATLAKQVKMGPGKYTDSRLMGLWI